MPHIARIVHTADVHLGRMAGLGPCTARHHERVAQAFERVASLAAEGADLLLIVGDLIDCEAGYGAFADRAVAILQQALAASPSLRVVIISGNHDPPSLYERPEWQPLGERVIIVTEPCVLAPERLGVDMHLVALPWMAAERLTWNDWPSGPVVVAAHACFPPPPQPRPEDCLLSRDEVARWPVAYVALGHYHTASEDRIANVPVVMSGAPEIMDLGHTGRGGAFIVTVEEDGRATYRWEETGELIGLGVQDLDWQELPRPRLEALRGWLEERADPAALLRVRLRGVAERPLHDSLDALRQDIADLFFFLDIVDETRPAIDLERAEEVGIGLVRRVLELAREKVRQAEAEGDAERAELIRLAAAMVYSQLAGGEEEQ